MTLKANLILLIIVSLFLAGLGTRSGSIALMALPFLVYLGAGLITSPGDVRIRAIRTLDCVRNHENAQVTMTFTIENEGAAIPRLQIDEPAHHQLDVITGKLRNRFFIHAGKKIDYSYTFRLPRGRYEWKQINATASDAFGLFEKTIHIPTSAQLFILPEPPLLRRFKFNARNTLHTPGSNLSRLPGCGVDFWGLREYHPGDSLRLINWRLTARHPNQFFSKVFEREEMADVGLILDTRGSNPHTGNNDDFFEQSIQATAALAKTFLRAGNRVSLLAMGERVIRVFPGYGKRQLVNILDKLAECRLEDTISLDTLRYFPVRLFPSHTMIVLISPLRSQDFKTIARLRAEGYQIVVVSPNPIRYIAREQETKGYGQLALRLVTLEREVLLWSIRKVGVEVVDWAVDQPLEKAIRSRRVRGMFG